MYGKRFKWKGFGARKPEAVAETGLRQVNGMARFLEAEMGVKLEGRRALDYGCGVGRVALPLAERCEHVYGVDLAPSVLEEAAASARDQGIENVDWLESEKIGTLAGRYDLLVSFFVFQHIPTRQGEVLLRRLVDGLQEGGVGYVHFILRPGNPLATLVRGGLGSGRGAFSFVKAYLYMVRCAYSLNRLAALLAEEGIRHVHVRTMPAKGPGFDSAYLVFSKS